ncbi:MAG TPA: radical SAM protein [Caldisericia bacterium]|mgnify:FL=1|nr:radical SAM protein [Caldisericia bacterium]HOL82849.1 radical SAM protein [Caldisericia bacterium]HON82907.1 radical SAM protein [Caldisericia bacterium]HPP43194.1 radical SAM protein [Caldisericia bacterium]
MYENIKVKKVIEHSLKEWETKGTTILFLGDCNMRCPYCNQKSLVLNSNSVPDIPYESIREFLMGNRKWIDGVVISGGEPSINPSLTFLLQDLKRMGFLTKILTNGTNEPLLRKLIISKLIDLISIDIKAPINEIKYKEVSKVNVDIRNLKNLLTFLKTSSFNYEISVTPHPSTMSEEDFEDIVDSLTGIKKFVIRKIEIGDLLDDNLRNIEPYSDEYINMLYLKAKRSLKECIVR